MVLIPLSDDAPLSRREAPFVTYVIIGLNIAVFAWRLMVADGGEDAAFDLRWGVVPATLFDGGSDALHHALTLVTYMFLHGGWAHILGNMLFLWIFGDDIEDALGHFKFTAFYLACGIAGAIAYALMSDAREAPLVGASGAIAGVMGAYLLVRPCAHVNVLVFIKIVPIRAMWVILMWLGLQVWHVLAPSDGNTAWWAHIGGLIAGVALTPLLRQPGVELLECVQQRTYVNPWGANSISRIPR